MIGTLQIRFRRLSQETLETVASINTLIESATEGRVSSSVAAAIFAGLRGAPADAVAQARRISESDALIIQDLIECLEEKVLCEGIDSWVDRNPNAPQLEHDDNNRLKIANLARTETLTKIFSLSFPSESERKSFVGHFFQAK